MIHFVCICGEPFDVPAEMAGDQLQCPNCKRLVDVPGLGDISAFDEDGTVRLGEAIVPPSALKDKFRTFSHRDDLRPTLDEFLIAGTGDQVLAPKNRAVPKYDPVTGELILPVGIADDTPPPPPISSDPTAPVLGYARTTAALAEDRPTLHWWTVPWRLLGGWSLMAMLFVWGAHVFVNVGLIIPGFNIFFVLPAFAIMLVIIAHYVNTIEEFGPNDRDAVPVLLRSVSLGEDVVGPLYRFGVSLLYAFFPLLAIAFFSPAGTFKSYPVLLFAPLGWGLLVFPVTLFTMVCGGVVNNLLPNRLLSVVTAAPIRYLLASVVFYVALVGYGVALGRIEPASPTALVPSSSRDQFFRMIAHVSLTSAIFFATVYLMHLAAAWLGMIYRAKHGDFQWVLQRHERVNRSDVMGQLIHRGTPRHVANQKRLRESGARRDPKVEVKAPGFGVEGFDLDL
jgi:hypothetical protein